MAGKEEKTCHVKQHKRWKTYFIYECVHEKMEEITQHEFMLEQHLCANKWKIIMKDKILEGLNLRTFKEIFCILLKRTQSLWQKK